MCKNSCHDYIDIISGKRKWGSAHIPTARTHWLEIVWKKKKKVVKDEICVISIDDDRDNLHAVALSIQYSWKCDTFPFQWMALNPKPFFFFFIHKHWLSISKHNWISQKSQSGWEGTASPCSAPSEAGRQQTHRAVWSPWNVPVLLSLTPLCSVLSADSWHGTRHARHNPPTWNRIEEQNSI